MCVIICVSVCTVMLGTLAWPECLAAVKQPLPRVCLRALQEQHALPEINSPAIYMLPLSLCMLT